MTTAEPDTLTDLIADCADIPSSLRVLPPALAELREAEPWRVDEVCLAQVRGLGAYV